MAERDERMQLSSHYADNSFFVQQVIYAGGMDTSQSKLTNILVEVKNGFTEAVHATFRELNCYMLTYWERRGLTTFHFCGLPCDIAAFVARELPGITSIIMGCRADMKWMNENIMAL